MSHAVRVTLVVGALIAFSPSRLPAHDPGFSTATVTLRDDGIEAIVTYSREEVEGELDRLDLTSGKLFLVGNGKPKAGRITYDDDNNALLHLHFPPDPGPHLTIHSPFLEGLVPGHRQFLLVRDRNRDLILQRLLKADAASVTFTHRSPDPSPLDPQPVVSSARNDDAFGKFLVSLAACLLFGFAFATSRLLGWFRFGLGNG